MKGLTISNLIKATDGEYYGKEELLEKEVTSVVTDSEKLLMEVFLFR